MTTGAIRTIRTIRPRGVEAARAIAFMSIAALLVSSGCASAVSKAPAAPHVGISTRDVSGPTLAGWLQDNPVALGRRRGEDQERERLAAERAAEKADAEAARAAEAREAAEAAKAPPNCEVEARKAIAALEVGDLDVAEKWAQIVIAKNPRDYPYAYVVLGDVELARGHAQAAYDAYAKALSLDPDDAWTVQRAAQALVKLGKRDAARMLLRGWLTKHDASDVDAWNALGWLDFDAADSAAAKDSFERACRLSGGKDPESWYGLAVIAARRSDTREAVRTLTALFALQPERRLVVERDPAFFRLRWWADVAALFADGPMAAARAAAEAKKTAVAPRRAAP
jgi:tetratricopeptide (TPR) repeat protein